MSVATVTKDLAAAVAAGLLRPEGQARSRRYAAGERLYSGIGAALGLMVSERGEVGRTIIVGELTKRAAAPRAS